MGVEKVSVALTEELAEEVREAVRTGDYASVSEVVREAVRTWMERRADTALLKRLVEDGLASGDCVGEGRQGRGRDARHVAQEHERAFGVRRQAGDAGAQRRAHPLGMAGAVDDL